MITERSVLNALILFGALVLAPYLISSLLYGDVVIAAIVAGLTITMICFFVIRDALCLTPLLCNSLAIVFNFLPMPLTAAQACCAMLVVYFIADYILIKQTPARLGNPRYFWPMVTIIGILLYHNHSLSLASVNGGEGSTEGSRRAFVIYLAFIAYLCGINIKTLPVQTLSRIPIYTVILSVVSVMPYLLSIAIPSLVPYLHLISNQIDVDSYADSVTGATGETAGVGRIIAVSVVGVPLQMYLVSRYPLLTWLRPERWWVILASLLSAALCVASGYRNVFFTYVLATLLASFCHYSWRSLAIPALALMAGIFVVEAGSQGLIDLPTDKLPMTFQRTLSFLPGDWSPEVLESTASSNFFRQNIIDVYMKEYFHDKPLFGHGYNIDVAVYHYWQALAESDDYKDRHYAEAKIFITNENFHTGWLSVYDAIGFVGSAAFILLGFNLIWTTAGWVFDPKVDRRSSLYPIYVWLFTSVFSTMITFFTVFGDLSSALSTLFGAAIVISQVSDVRKSNEVPQRLPNAVESPNAYGFGAARY